MDCVLMCPEGERCCSHPATLQIRTLLSTEKPSNGMYLDIMYQEIVKKTSYESVRRCQNYREADILEVQKRNGRRKNYYIYIYI